MRKLLILILVTGVILDEPAPPCVHNCEVEHMVDMEEKNYVETCGKVQDLLDCVKESCNDTEIYKCMYDRVKNVQDDVDENNYRCDFLLDDKKEVLQTVNVYPI